ncbi:histidinol-phosphatase HisJ [candidate division KSB1 bacterium]|nr:histidinol-phosphatase HisJ [candidate division KSB1 bacterium]
MNIIPDPHVHTQFCGHAQGSVRDMVQFAVEKGLPGLGFAEHFPYPQGYHHKIKDAVVPSDQWSIYIEEVLQIQKEFSDRIAIKLAVEVDFIPDYITQTREKLATQFYDYIYGSVHLVDDVLIDYSESYLQHHLGDFGGVKGLWSKYWDRMEQMIQSDFCNVVTHLDLPKKFKISEHASTDLERVQSILTLIKEHDLTLEVNTGGIDRSSAGEPYPSLSILKMAADIEIDILIGSDAHRPEEIGRHFETVAAQLKSIGFNSIVDYTNRKKSHILL